MNIIGTGLSGLVGSRVVELLKHTYTFEDLSLETGIDITDYPAVRKKIERSSASWIFHFAAYTDVQGAQKEEHLGEASVAWKINVAATQNIIDIARVTKKKLVYIDTDYAFDGRKKEYWEEDSPNPAGWYAKTKYEGAKRVLTLGNQALVMRIANPYRANPTGKKDFVHKMRERLEQGQTINAAVDQTFAPTFIDDIAAALDIFIARDSSGLYHVVGSSIISPYEAGLLIAKIWGYSKSLVRKTSFADFFKDRAPVPQHAGLKNDRIRLLGIHMHTFEAGIWEVKRQEEQKA